MPKCLATCVALLLFVTLFSSPAQAATGVFLDGSGDVTGVARTDLTSVTLANQPDRVALKVRFEQRNTGGMSVDGPFSWWSVFLDTDRRRPGPEWRVRFGYETPIRVGPMRRWKVQRSRAWANNYSRMGRCARGVKMDVVGTSVRVVIPKKKGCFTARNTRVHARLDSMMAQMYGSSATVTDELPNGRRTWSREVKVRTSRTTRDQRDRVDWWADIRKVGVALTSERLRVDVRHLPRREFFGRMQAFLDTDQDGSPDWLLWVGEAGGGSGVLPMTGWDQIVGEGSNGCPIDARIAGAGSSISYVDVPASCIGTPASVRVAVHTEQFADGNHHPEDWLGGRRSWSVPVVAD